MLGHPQKDRLVPFHGADPNQFREELHLKQASFHAPQHEIRLPFPLSLLPIDLSALYFLINLS